jgi:hypothetical protein
VTGEVTRINYSGSVPLKGAILDPEYHLLLDDDFKNNFGLAPSEPPSHAERTLERVFYWMELAIQTVLP